MKADAEALRGSFDSTATMGDLEDFGGLDEPSEMEVAMDALPADAARELEAELDNLDIGRVMLAAFEDVSLAEIAELTENSPIPDGLRSGMLRAFDDLVETVCSAERRIAADQ